MKPTLKPEMTVDQFDNGYWYAKDLKTFATTLKIPTTRRRKDELETAIRHFLTTGEIPDQKSKSAAKTGPKDIDIGLTPNLPIRHYTSNKITKDFIAKQVAIHAPGLKPKSGARCRLNRWRENQIAAGNPITYGDLIRQYIALNRSEDSFARIPHGRYVNFIADFMKNEPDATRDQAIRAWKRLKDLDVPKTYEGWKSKTGT